MTRGRQTPHPPSLGQGKYNVWKKGGKQKKGNGMEAGQIEDIFNKKVKEQKTGSQGETEWLSETGQIAWEPWEGAKFVFPASERFKN